MKRRRKLNKAKAKIACKLINRDFEDYKIQEGYYYRVRLTDEEFEKVNDIYNSLSTIEGKDVGVKDIEKDSNTKIDKEYEEFKAMRNTDFSFHKIEAKKHPKGTRYAIALFSDAHIEERVTLESTLGLNEYTPEIAMERIDKYFINLSSCIQRDRVNKLYFGCLGDIISSYLHPELEQTNYLTPPEAIVRAQSILISGLKFLREDNPKLDIVFLGVTDNHQRITKKVQHNNGFKMSYGWILYQNLKTISETIGLDIEFIIPKAEIALLEMPDGKRFIFCHGHQIRSTGNNAVCGIYPSLQRLVLKWQKTFNQDKIFLGHFHSCVSLPNATVNGSVIGYNAYCVGNGFPYEEPAQMYEVYDTEIGQLLTRKIYCK